MLQAAIIILVCFLFLPLQLQRCESKQSSDSMRLPQVPSNHTEMPCVSLNFCEKLKVNITSDQLLRLYNASKEQYRTVQEFVLKEWRSIREVIRSNLNDTDFAFDPTLWQKYLAETQNAFSTFLESFNSTMESMSNFSENVAEPESHARPGLKKRLQKRLSKVAKTVQKGFNHVKSGIVDKLGSLMSEFSGESKTVDRESKRSHNKRAKEKQKSKQTKKFEKRLEKLRQDLLNMDVWRAQKMKRYRFVNATVIGNITKLLPVIISDCNYKITDNTFSIKNVFTYFLDMSRRICMTDLRILERTILTCSATLT